MIPPVKKKVERVVISSASIIISAQCGKVTSDQNALARCFSTVGGERTLFANRHSSLMLTGTRPGMSGIQLSMPGGHLRFMNIHDFIVPENLREPPVSTVIVAVRCMTTHWRRSRKSGCRSLSSGQTHPSAGPIISRDSLKNSVLFLD